jgi:GntR family transcriptional regulator, transcriptional repressor for pyruvate dehydrogenase complex
MLEPPLAARAATHASPDEISEMEEILQRQERKLSRGETTIAEDAEFHYSVALASGNSVVLKVLDILMDLLRETRERSLQVEGRPEKVSGWPPADSRCDQASGCGSRKGSHAAAH